MAAYDEPPSAYARRAQAERDEEARAKKERPHARARASLFDFVVDVSGPIDSEAIAELLRAFAFAAEQRVAEARRRAPPPPPPPPRPAPAGWRSALGFPESARPTFAEAKAAYRAKMLDAHPDRGGSDAAATALNLAWERARRELGR